MAVQAQYPANLLLLDRAETETETETNNNDMDCPPPLFFPSNGGNPNPKKRPRDFSTPPISTGLRLAFNEQNQIRRDLSAQIDQQKDEIEEFFLAQQEQLRRGLIDRRNRQCRAFLSVLEKSVNNRIRAKEAEMDLAHRKTTELENRLARVRSELTAWQSKAMAEQAMAASIHAQLQRAAAAAEFAGVEDLDGESPAEDAESAHIDPERAEAAWGGCRSCLRRTATVVLVPCRHLCLCPACDFAVAGERCPVCGVARSGSVHVLLS